MLRKECAVSTEQDLVEVPRDFFADQLGKFRVELVLVRVETVELAEHEEVGVVGGNELSYLFLCAWLFLSKLVAWEG